MGNLRQSPLSHKLGERLTRRQLFQPAVQQPIRSLPLRDSFKLMHSRVRHPMIRAHKLRPISLPSHNRHRRQVSSLGEIKPDVFIQPRHPLQNLRLPALHTARFPVVVPHKLHAEIAGDAAAFRSVFRQQSSVLLRRIELRLKIRTRQNLQPVKRTVPHSKLHRRLLSHRSSVKIAPKSRIDSRISVHFQRIHIPAALIMSRNFRQRRKHKPQRIRRSVRILRHILNKPLRLMIQHETHLVEHAERVAIATRLPEVQRRSQPHIHIPLTLATPEPVPAALLHSLPNPRIVLVEMRHHRRNLNHLLNMLHHLRLSLFHRLLSENAFLPHSGRGQKIANQPRQPRRFHAASCYTAEQFLYQTIETRLSGCGIPHHHSEHNMDSIQTPIHQPELLPNKVAIHQPQPREKLNQIRSHRLAIMQRLSIHILRLRHMRLLRRLENIVALAALNPTGRQPKLIKPKRPLFPHHIQRDNPPIGHS